MKKLLLYIISALSLVQSGCISQKRYARICATCPAQTVTDTLTETITTTVVDTIVLPADSAIYKALIECQNGVPVITQTYVDDGANVSIFGLEQPGQGDKKTLMVKALKPKDVIPATKNITTNNKKVSSIKTTYHACPGLTRWQLCQIWFGRAFMGLLVFLLLRSAYRLYKKLRYPL